VTINSMIKGQYRGEKVCCALIGCNCYMSERVLTNRNLVVTNFYWLDQ
jgi:hypothetical protein